LKVRWCYFFLRFYDFDQIAGQSALYKAHAAVGEIIVRYNGTLERYAGDGIMIIFNDPNSGVQPRSPSCSNGSGDA
jgi:class 3 adenylate cyclase